MNYILNFNNQKETTMIYNSVEILKKLEVVKNIRELDFVESEFNYKSEMLKEIDYEFKKEVENVLSLNSELKDVFTKCVDDFNREKTKVLNERYENINMLEEVETIEKNPKVKTLYRVIAKTTHPDKVNDDNLKELYLEATKAYENNNLLPIISICDKLKIPYEVDEEEYDFIKEQIESIKKRTNFLESTYTWQWYVRPHIDEKNQIVLNFIKAQMF
jgi:hypothetical protein